MELNLVLVYECICLLSLRFDLFLLDFVFSITMFLSDIMIVVVVPKIFFNLIFSLDISTLLN